jgi:hypothetical protein
MQEVDFAQGAIIGLVEETTILVEIVSQTEV